MIQNYFNKIYQILPSNLIYPFFMIMFSFLIINAFLNFFLNSKKLNKNKKVFDKKTVNIMLLSLFISFDPKSSMNFYMFEEMNWMTGIMFSFIIINSFWKTPSREKIFYEKFMIEIGNQFSIALKSMKDGSQIFFLVLFTTLMTLNLMGLIPNVFTSTSHISLNFMISFSLWLGFLIFGWYNHMNKMFAHLVPLSTPSLLISFMIIIELISNLIRPLTLAIRLMANMISGHLLLTLMGNSMSNNIYIMLMFMIIIQTMLMLLELGVSLIQAYVFCMLLTLYSDSSEYKVLN